MGGYVAGAPARPLVFPPDAPALVITVNQFLFIICRSLWTHALNRRAVTDNDMY